MQTIFIYGPPGSGKTTLGKLLAGRFSVPFEDLDDSIVQAAGGKSIPAIFAEEGESGFRARERAALEAAASSSMAKQASDPKAAATAKAVLVFMALLYQK